MIYINPFYSSGIYTIFIPGNVLAFSFPDVMYSLLLILEFRMVGIRGTQIKKSSVKNK